eukprot:Selendium_serpulae@DN6288_c0_g2_i2.p1
MEMMLADIQTSNELMEKYMMLADIQKTNELMEKYRRGQGERQPAAAGVPKVRVSVLTKNSKNSKHSRAPAIWPFGGEDDDGTRPQTNDTLVMPKPIREECKLFSIYYQHHNKSRALTWKHELGSADVKFYRWRLWGSTTVSASSKHDHILTASALQTAILCLFNDKKRFSYKDIKNNTNIKSDDELFRHLVPLCGSPSEECQTRRRCDPDLSRATPQRA